MYKTAIVRRPGKSFSEGITTSKLGTPNVEKAIVQHKSYVNALIQSKVKVIILEADEKFPDACFVEDTAIVTDELAIITRPGDIRRRGEEEKIAETLKKYKRLERIVAPGKLDGGDVLKVGRSFYIGRSERTNAEGAKQLNILLSNLGYSCSEISVGSMLHLKSGVSSIGENNLIVNPSIAKHFKGYNLIQPLHKESYACNTVYLNGHLLIPKGFPILKQKLLNLDYQLIEIDCSEFQKMDGGLSCLSLLF